MSVGWGLLADIDIESERFRKTLGSARFTAGAVFRVARLKTYKGRVSFIPVGEKWKHRLNVGTQQDKLARSQSENNTTAESVMRGNTRTHDKPGLVHSSKSTNQLNSYRHHDSRKSSTTTWSTPSEEIKPTTPVDTEKFYLEVMHNRFYSFDLSMQWGLLFFQIEFEGSQDRLDESSKELANKKASNGLDRRRKSDNGTGEAMRFSDLIPMPPLDKPIPPGQQWVSLEEEFVLIYAAYLSHLSADILYLPEAKLDEDQIYLTLIKAGAPRSQLAKFLMAMQSGEHLDNPYFEVSRPNILSANLSEVFSTTCCLV